MKPIFKALLVFLAVLVTTLAGCQLADNLVGGTGKNDSGNLGIIGTLVGAGSAAPGWLGWVVGLLGGAAAGYKTYRNKQLGAQNDNYKEAVEALVVGIEKLKDGVLKDKVNSDDVHAVLNEIKNQVMTNPAFLTDLIALIKSKYS